MLRLLLTNIEQNIVSENEKHSSLLLKSVDERKKKFLQPTTEDACFANGKNKLGSCQNNPRQNVPTGYDPAWRQCRINSEIS